MSTKSSKSKSTNYVIGLVILLVGITIGYLANNLMQTHPASAQQIEQTKNEIAKLYKEKTVDACWTVNKGANLAGGKYEFTYRNLRLNKTLDRAIVTDCGEYDTLLYKNKSGQWVETSVNLVLGNRVNSVWQKACKIEDITVADDQVRPENSSIDDTNLQECNQISRQ